MKTTARLNYLRIAPRKVRLMADMIRGKKTEQARNILIFAKQKPAQVVLKLLNQAIANAKNNLKLDETNLYISEIMVNEGPKLKRFRPRARGSAYEIQKKTSHIIISLEEVEKGKKLQAEKTEEKEPVKFEKTEKTAKTEKPKFQREEAMKAKTEKQKQKIFRRQTF